MALSPLSGPFGEAGRRLVTLLEDQVWTANVLNSDAIDAVTTWAKFVCLCSLIIMFANGVIFIWRLRTRHVAVWDRLGRTGMLLWQGPWLSQEARSFMKNREFLQLGDPLIRLTWRVNRVLGFLIIARSLWVFIAANLAWSR